MAWPFLIVVTLIFYFIFTAWFMLPLAVIAVPLIWQIRKLIFKNKIPGEKLWSTSVIKVYLLFWLAIVLSLIVMALIDPNLGITGFVG